jgi:dTDP-4-amino-4,6-dideoxygalactose transaminase
MCPKSLEQKLIKAKALGNLPKVVIPVHLCGQPCDMAAIARLAKEYDFKVIEDASHAIGGQYQNVPIGRCEHSDITVFSFHPVKIVTTAEGGAALTNNKELADKMALLRSHGVTRDPAKMKGESHGDWYYQQVDLGFNYRMTELQAALGISQMTRLNEFVASRHALARGYYKKLASLPITLPYQLPNTYSGLHLFVIRLQLDRLRLSHQEVFKALRAQGIGVNLHYIPVHTQPYYLDMGFAEGDYPYAEQYYREAISLPMFHGMTEEQQNTVVSVLTEILKAE